MPTILSDNILALRRHLKLNQTQFGEVVQSDQGNVSKWEGKGVTPGGIPLARMAELAKTSVEEFTSSKWAPRGRAGNQRPEQEATRSADAGETATVMRLELSLAMGPGTNLDDDYVEGEPVELDISFLRRLTPSAPDKLRIVNGVGDSMQPTLYDSEELIVDLAQHSLNMQDRIWAISLFGVGAVKRLQASGRTKVLVISDNPDVPNREVSTGDIRIVGRVVGSIRRH